MKYLIFRNHTVEHLFSDLNADYSGYGDLLCPTDAADVLIWFYALLPQADTEISVEEVRTFKKNLTWTIDRNPGKPFIVFLLSRRLSPVWVHSDRTLPMEIEKYNELIISLSNTNQLVRYIDIDEYFNGFSQNQLLVWKYYLMSQMLLAPVHSRSFNSWFANKFAAMEGQRRKCLIVDLDNTLWGGILGEDELSGIELGDTYPGLAYRIFQEYISMAGKKGIILAICSKNNLSDIEEVWDKHPNMILKQDHFAAWRINWNNKATNIQELAAELNIGLDSMVFIDDNPVERDLIRQMLPEVAVPEFPSDPFALPEFFSSVWNEHFQIYKLTDEDIRKTEQYRQNAERVKLKTEFVSETDYLKSLEMVLSLLPASDLNITRIAQMTQKTNQFNLTTRRYSVNDLHQMLANGCMIYCLNVKDRFGDNGITAACIIKPGSDAAVIDTFLLSCRIIGRDIEKQFLYLMINKLKSAGHKTIKAIYIPTKKNQQTMKFYDNMGFKLTNDIDSVERKYEFTIGEELEILDYFTVREESIINE